MTYDIKMKQDMIYLVENDEVNAQGKKQKKIFKTAEENLRKLVVERLNGKTGDC
jgi:hypothetical protein